MYVVLAVQHLTSAAKTRADWYSLIWLDPADPLLLKLELFSSFYLSTTKNTRAFSPFSSSTDTHYLAKLAERSGDLTLPLSYGNV
jgi:hypothetical protein